MKNKCECESFKVIVAALTFVLAMSAPSAFAAVSGAIYTTDKTATIVNGNTFANAGDVYISGGPQNKNANGLDDGTYYFQVTDPSGGTLLSTDNAVCRQLTVSGGRVTGSTGPACKHANGTFNPANGVTPVQLAPFSTTPNAGNVYKAWVVPTASAGISGTDPKVLIFSNSDAKTDNFKVPAAVVVVPPGSCQPSSSLSVLVSGTNVTSYVPKGAWSSSTPDVSVVNIEGSSVTPTRIPTSPHVINSCASNSTTGVTVCTANDTNVYLLSGTSVSGSPLTSGGSGTIGFSGGSCTNCGVAMDATNNRAAIGLSVGSVPSFQILDLATNTFGTAFASQTTPKHISEDPLIDPIRNRLWSATETNQYEAIDISTATPSFFEHAIPGSGEPDSSGEDCSTQIILTPREFTSPSVVYLADTSQATFTAGSPGTWTLPLTAENNQSLSESFLAAGASGIAIAQGTGTGIVSGEFGGNTLTAITLPTTSGSGTPAITDWVTCSISGFSNGLDPHTVTAYKSPNSGDAIALLANGGASTVQIVDLTKMLNTTTVPRTVGGHGCASGTLPATVVSSVSVP